MNPRYSEINARFLAKDYEGALALIDFGLAKSPYDITLYRAKARLFRATNNLKAAEKWYTAALTHGSTDYDDYFERAVNRFESENYDGAIADFSAAELIKDDDYLLYFKRGGAYWDIYEWGKAAADFNKAIKLNPRNADVVWVSGLVDLQRGDFNSGWRKYESRWLSEVFKSNQLVTEKPLWSEKSNLKRVLLWGEQGIGDQIFYSGMLPYLRTLVDKVTMMIDPRLVSLFQRSMPDINFIPNTEKVPVEDHDCHLPIANLCANLIHSFEDIEKYMSRNYLKPDPKRVEEIKQHFNEDFAALSWTSNSFRIGPMKSVSLKELKFITDTSNLNFVSVQYTNTNFDEQHLRIKKTNIDCKNDFEGLAALLSLSKCLVSVSNSNVHLAGALGVPVLLMESNKLWYWGHRDKNNVSHWYPSVKVFPRKKVSESWLDTIELVKKEMAAIC